MATKFPENFRRVSGQIYAGGAPDQDFLEFFKNTLGGRTVISLDATIAQNIVPIVKNLKMAHVIIPINLDAGATLTDPIKLLVRQIKSNLIDNAQPVYIHCLHGSDRTGLTIALYRVIKQNWNCDSAISEGVRWGYGNGISLNTQKLWKNLICAKGANAAATAPPETDTQAIDDDIVENMRDNFDGGNVPPAFMPQQSWAPYVDLDNQASKYDPRIRKRLLRRKMLSNLDKDLMADVNDDNIPMVGQFDNYGPMRGSGPVENSGILQLL